MPEDSLSRVFLLMRYIRPPDNVVLRDFRGHEGPGTSAARRMTMSSESRPPTHMATLERAIALVNVGDGGGGGGGGGGDCKGIGGDVD